MSLTTAECSEHQVKGKSHSKTLSKWKFVSLAEVCSSLFNGGTPSTKINGYWSGKIPWITGADIVDQKIKDIRRWISTNAVKNSSTHVVPKDSLLIVTRTGIGKLAIAPFDIAISQDITGFIPNSSVDVSYLFWVMDYNQNRLKKFNQGTSINGIKRSDLLEFIIPLPSICEQRKIASLLSSVDAAIEQTDAIIAQTERMKASLMQELFTNGIGHEEFKHTPIGCIPKCWLFGGVDDIVNGGNKNGIKPGPFGSSLKKQFYVSKGYRVYGQEQVLSGTLDIGDYFIDDNRFNKLKDFKIDTGDVLISLVGTIGKVLVVPLVFQPGIINPRLLKITPNRDVCDPAFLSYLLQSKLINTQILKLCHGQTMLILNKSIIKRLVFGIPPLPEQKKIAEILNIIEEKIRTERVHHEILKMLKRGLMQDLLTGRIRVKVDGHA